MVGGEYHTTGARSLEDRVWEFDAQLLGFSTWAYTVLRLNGCPSGSIGRREEEQMHTWLGVWVSLLFLQHWRSGMFCRVIAPNETTDCI